MAKLTVMLPNGQQTKANSESVVLASDHQVIQVTNTGIGDVTDTATVAPSQNGGIISILKGIWVEAQTFNERLAMLARSIMRPSWFDPNIGALRVSGSGQTFSTITTVSTVSTLSNQSQVGSVDAKTGFVDEIMMNTWMNSIRRNIT